MIGDGNDQERPARDAALQPARDFVGHAARNDAAALAKVFGLLSFIPCLAILTGPLAVVFGILGLRRNRVRPTLHGHRNSWLGIGVGSLLFVISVAFLAKVSLKSLAQYRREHGTAVHTHHEDTGGDKAEVPGTEGK